MHPALLTSEPADVRHGSGTAVAAANLVEAFALNGVSLAVVRARPQRLGHSAGRARFNVELRRRRLDYDALLGIGGDGVAAATSAGIPFVALPKALYTRVRAHERGLTRALLRGHAAFEAGAARRSALVIVPSRFAAAAVHQEFDVPWARIEVIAEPFPFQRWRADLPQPRREGRRALVVAHLYPRKRVVDVVAAWPAVRRARPDAELDIAGDGPSLGEVRRAAADQPGITVHGHVEPDRLRHLHATADVLVSASAHETFGYAVLEGLASGLPIVAARAPAVVELCAGALAEQVAVGDVAALGRAILSCLDSGVADAAAAVNPALAARSESATIGAEYLTALGKLAG
jgi:glycosyltransferase involved in cell wall biosynthesis